LKPAIAWLAQNRIYISWLAAIAAIVSAVLWFWASLVPVSAKNIIGFGGPTEKTLHLLSLQAELNRNAAIATGISAILQAVLLALRKHDSGVN
jgi:hypothetical protein